MLDLGLSGGQNDGQQTKSWLLTRASGDHLQACQVLRVRCLAPAAPQRLNAHAIDGLVADYEL